MPGEKKDNAREVRVTVRMSIPLATMDEVQEIELDVGLLADGFEGATYEVGIGTPRPAIARP